MPALATLTDRMNAAWVMIAARYEAYGLGLPGSCRFECQPDLCDAHCCRAFSVNLGASEVARMQRESTLQPVQFLECEDGEPITLPMAQPFLLARAENRCGLLGADLRCTQYHGRPDACRLYPHFVIFVDPKNGRPVTADLPVMSASFEAALAGREGRYVPLLLRHSECPGFTGPPMDHAEWEALLCATYQLQYPPR